MHRRLAVFCKYDSVKGHNGGGPSIEHFIGFKWLNTNTFTPLPLSVYILGSLLDFLKSETGCKVQLPKLIDFSAQVISTLTGVWFTVACFSGLALS